MREKLGLSVPSNQRTAKGFGVAGVKFRASLTEMAPSEMLAMISPKTLETIKRSDPNPMFKAFVVGHEGESKGNLIGLGNVVKRWFKTMIRALGTKIKAGLQLFNGHAAGTNSHDGREPIGQVAGSEVRQIDGRESVIVACHIFPAYRHLPLDVASVETSVLYDQKEDGSLEITDIESVTGIALGNSAISQPGFAGATLLGQLQAFESQLKIETGPALKLGYRNNNTGSPDNFRLA